METFLKERGLLDDEEVAAIGQRARDEIAELVDAAEAVEPDPSAMFEHVYADTPPRVRERQEHLEELRRRHGDDALTRDE